MKGKKEGGRKEIGKVEGKKEGRREEVRSGGGGGRRREEGGIFIDSQLSSWRNTL